MHKHLYHILISSSRGFQELQILSKDIDNWQSLMPRYILLNKLIFFKGCCSCNGTLKVLDRLKLQGVVTCASQNMQNRSGNLPDRVGFAWISSLWSPALPKCSPRKYMLNLRLHHCFVPWLGQSKCWFAWPDFFQDSTGALSPSSSRSKQVCW